MAENTARREPDPEAKGEDPQGSANRGLSGCAWGKLRPTQEVTQASLDSRRTRSYMSPPGEPRQRRTQA